MSFLFFPIWVRGSAWRLFRSISKLGLQRVSDLTQSKLKDGACYFGFIHVNDKIKNLLPGRLSGLNSRRLLLEHDGDLLRFA